MIFIKVAVVHASAFWMKDETILHRLQVESFQLFQSTFYLNLYMNEKVSVLFHMNSQIHYELQHNLNRHVKVI